MPRLVAVREAGPAFVDALREAWERGDAVLPVDPRLPPAAAQDLVHQLCVGDDVEAGDALVVATSGTTGRPKGVVLTHDAVEAAALAASGRLGADPGADTWLCCLPVAHVGGLSVVTRALVTGTGLVFGDVDSGGCQATLVSVVATQLARTDPSRFRRVVVGGSAAPPALPPNAVVTYGLTETGGGCVYDGVPLDGVEVRVEPDGTIAVRGPGLLRCYRGAGGEVDPRGAGGWLRTADAGTIAADGRLVVHGRRDDVIVTGGENVWPDPVEDVLRTVPGVADVAVVGRPDDEWGQRVVAVVVPAGPPPTLDTLRGAVKDVLAPWCAPRELIFVEALPRTPLGKLRRAELRTALGG